MGNFAHKLYSSYLDCNSYFTLQELSNLHVFCRREGKVIYDDYAAVSISYDEMAARVRVSIYWDEYESIIGGSFSDYYYQIKFYPKGEKLHIDGNNKHGALINMVVSLPPKLRN